MINEYDSKISSSDNADMIEKLKKKKNKWIEVNSELDQMESSTDIFRLRTGKNISSNSGAGNLRFNVNTYEIDVNYTNGNEYTLMANLGHELKHGFQFLMKELAFTLENGKIAYDQSDEVEAFYRSELIDPNGFLKMLKAGNHSNIYSFIEEQKEYKNLPATASSVPYSEEQLIYMQTYKSYPALTVSTGYRERFKLNEVLKAKIKFRK